MISMIMSVGLSACPCEWVHPRAKDVQTVFYQGINASQTQVSKYTGTRGFIATTREHVACKYAFDVIEHPFIGKELDEVQLKCMGDKNISSVKAFFHHPISFLEHYFYILTENRAYGITIENVHNNQEFTVAAHTIRLGAMSLGQKGDIEEHKIRYDLCRTQYPDSDIILFGVSRGAAATFDACSCNHYDKSKIKLVILESCFDSIAGIIHDSSVFLGWQKLEKIAINALSSFTKFKNDGMAPIKLIADFPEQVPVLFVTSKKDMIVPLTSVSRVVHALAMRGKNPLYMVVLERSGHSTYMMDDAKDTENYRDCLHALYKLLDLPYIPVYAQAGEKRQLLTACLCSGSSLKL